jgi:hypothetical protein
VLALVGGCGGGAGRDSPEAMARAVIDAMNKKDPAAIRALFPPDDVAAKAGTCKDPARSPAVAMARARDDFAHEITTDKLKGVSFEFVALQFDPADRVKYPKGVEDPDTGCTPTDDLEVLSARLVFKATSSGSSEQSGERITLISLSGTWYLLDM